tara:strand:- start:2652 stop:5354 length:2703 start_codon:yes stop_codon:yes gene_type:complete
MAISKEQKKIIDDIIAGISAGSILDETEGVAQAYRWRSQCLLAASLGDITKEVTSTHAKPWRYVTSFSTVGDTGNGTTADFLNRLHLQDSSTDPKNGFVNLSTYERSQLLWNLKLSKVIYSAKVSAADKVTYEYAAEVPLVFEQMAADDMQKYKDGENYYVQTAPDEFDSTGAKTRSGEDIGRPDTGYGIKSFSWNFQGGNPETIRNDIEATLVMEFQNFNQLTRVRTALGAKSAPGGTIGSSKITKYEPLDYSLLDLLGYGPSSPKVMPPSDNDEKASPDTYDPALVEIKAVVGWDCNPQNSDLKSKIAGQKTTLFLTMIDHEFSISQVGTFTLTLSYRARLESAMAQMRANVVFSQHDAGASSQISGTPNYSVVSEVLSRDVGYYEEVELLDISIAMASKECNETLIKTLMTRRDKALRRAWESSFENFFKNELKNDFLESHAASRLKQHSGIQNATPTGKYYHDGDWMQIWKIKYKNSSIATWMNGTSKRDTPEFVGPIGRITSTAGALGPSMQAIEDIFTPVGGEGDNFLERNFNAAATGTQSIYFILLGDILDRMAHRALSKEYFLSEESLSGGSFGSAEKIKIICGPVRLKTDHGEVVCSLSDLPIGVEAFMDFWYTNVIQRDREVYNILDFIRDFADQVISKAYGQDCAFGMKRAFSGLSQIKTGFIQIPPVDKKEADDPLFHLNKGVYHPVTGDLLVEQLPKVIDPSRLAETKPEDVHHYLVLYMSTVADMSSYTGTEKKDMEKGIYHLKVHQGILQSIDFQKTDQPYLRESRFFRHNENPLVHLSNVYKIRASMVGNTLFYPGQMVYINPIGFGTSLGDPMKTNSISNVMGLGGYHVIISVSNSVSRDFTTEIVAQWDNNGESRPRSGWNPPNICQDDRTADEKKLEGDNN